MDHSLRELGVTDLGVGPRIKKMGDVFYGLARVLGQALDHADLAAIEDVLVRNVYLSPNAGAAPLAAYLLAESRRLAAEPVTILTGAAA
jgi:cytochrome b pre-mRNA-processing protein 3